MFTMLPAVVEFVFLLYSTGSVLCDHTNSNEPELHSLSKCSAIRVTHNVLLIYCRIILELPDKQKRKHRMEREKQKKNKKHTDI